MAVPPQLHGYVPESSGCIRIQRDHFDLAKFRTRDSDYWELCKKIQVFYQNSQELIFKRIARKKQAFSEGVCCRIVLSLY
jgi:hypothetical protein